MYNPKHTCKSRENEIFSVFMKGLQHHIRKILHRDSWFLMVQLFYTLLWLQKQMLIWFSNQSHHKKARTNKNIIKILSSSVHPKADKHIILKIKCNGHTILGKSNETYRCFIFSFMNLHYGWVWEGDRNVQIAEAITTEPVILNALSIWSYRINAS